MATQLFLPKTGVLMLLGLTYSTKDTKLPILQISVLES